MIDQSNHEAAALLGAAREHYQRGQIQATLDSLLKISESLRSSEDVLLLKGVCLARLKKHEEAVRALETVLDLNPNCYEALSWLAVLTKKPDQIHQAIDYAQRAIRLQPGEASGYSSLGACYLTARDAPNAIEAFQKAVELSPNIAENQHNLALALLMARRHGEAIQCLRRAIELAPNNPESYLTLASAYGLFGMMGETLDCLSQALKRMPNSAPLHSAAAGAFAMIGNDHAAELHHRRAMELSPKYRGGYATWLLNQGRFEEANRIFDGMIADGQAPAYALYSKMQTVKLSGGSHEIVGEMESLLCESPPGRTERMYLHYALGRAKEQLKQFERAIGHFDRANEIAYEIHRAARPFDIAETQQEHRAVQRLFLQLPPIGSASPTDGPIFIVGMIRSGTTLLDQILSGHPGVASGGELRFWIEEALRLVAKDPPASLADVLAVGETYRRYVALLTDRSSRATDKMPLNFAYVGLIRAAMPGARFIHIRRHPVDTCLSIYTTYFGAGALFAYRQESIVSYYREYLNAMRFWRENLPPGVMIEVDYENLVAQPEPEVRRLVEFCGLPWNDACLHPDQNQSAINTPSRWQARQPVYKTSTERWRNYEPWLGAFGDLL